MNANILQIPPAEPAPLGFIQPSLGMCDRGEFRINLARLLATRLLIQAASGGGKSWLLRRLLEQTNGLVHQIVIDPEGELTSLAEKYDFLVCSPTSTEAPITPANGDRVADILFRSRRSAILALDEFDVEDMQEFVAAFVSKLLRMPKELWAHTLVAFDEVQLFCPQHDKAASKKPMLDLAARGRKRGLCTVAATQRLSQVHKGLVAHLENKLIGLTTLDVDVERAADQIGMRVGVARDTLRRLDAGEFLAYGPGLSYDLTKITVGRVETRHGVLGQFEIGMHLPMMSREEVGQQLKHASIVAPASACVGDGEDGDVEAFPRYRAIAPLLTGQPTREQVQLRAEELGVGVSTVYRWLDQYDQAIGPSSLEGERTPKKLIATLRRLACLDRQSGLAREREQAEAGLLQHVSALETTYLSRHPKIPPRLHPWQ